MRIPGSVVTLSQKKQQTKIHAQYSEELFNSVSIRAANIGMRVNKKKTQLLCISDNTTSEVTSYIRTGGEKIISTNELKILGFVFGNTSSVWPHVNYMLNKARKRLWTICHAKKAGMGKVDLLKIFNVFIRPILEFAAPTFHPMLNNTMKDEIELIQKRACKMIFGWDSSYDVLVSNGSIETLDSRREKLTINFAKKCASSARFGHWFEEKPANNLRSGLRYEEKFARTERLKNSPLFYMRRALNNE